MSLRKRSLPERVELATGAKYDLIARFILVGVCNSALYTAGFLLASRGLKLPASIASNIGYLFGLAFGFFLHRSYTFATSGGISSQAVRYGLAQLAVMTVVALFAQITSMLGFPTWVVIGGGILAAPPLNFILLNRWVFARAA